MEEVAGYHHYTGIFCLWKQGWFQNGARWLCISSLGFWKRFKSVLHTSFNKPNWFFLVRGAFVRFLPNTASSHLNSWTFAKWQVKDLVTAGNPNYELLQKIFFLIINSELHVESGNTDFIKLQYWRLVNIPILHTEFLLTCRNAA